MIKGAQNSPVSVDTTLRAGRQTKFSRQQPTKAQRSSSGIALLFFNFGARWLGGQSHTPAALPPGKTRYPLYRRLGGPQGRSARVRNISPPPGFDPRTVQRVACSYTDNAIPAQGRLTNRSSIPGRDKKFSLLWCIQTYFGGPHSQSNSESGSPSRRVKEIGTWDWSLAPPSVEFNIRGCNSISSYDFTTCQEHHFLTIR
jgi:hypothetical protein